MKKTILILCILAFIASSCNFGKQQTATTSDETITEDGQDGMSNEIVAGTWFGDLNGDGEDDRVTITQQDRNNPRLGMKIALKKGENYEEVWSMTNLFWPKNDYENYDPNGSGYRTGEAYIIIEDGKLMVHYNDAHDSNAWWQYVFRLRDNELEIIGFDAFRTNLPDYESKSINFLTGKMLLRNEHTPEGKKKESWYTLRVTMPLNLKKLSEEIRSYAPDFDDLNAMMFTKGGWHGWLEIVTLDYLCSDLIPHGVDVNKIHPDSIQVINETCLVTVFPTFLTEDEQKMAEEIADDWGWHSYETAEELKKMGVKNISSNKEYLLFKSADQDDIYVNTKNFWKQHTWCLLLYRQVKKGDKVPPKGGYCPVFIDIMNRHEQSDNIKNYLQKK